MSSEIIIVGTAILTLISGILTMTMTESYYEVLFLLLTMFLAVATLGSAVYIVASSHAAYLGIVRSAYTAVSWGSVLVVFFIIVGLFKDAVGAWGK